MQGSGCDKLKQGDQFGDAEAPPRGNGDLACIAVRGVERRESAGPGHS